MRGQLVKQLLDAVSLSGAVDVRHPVLRETAEVLVHLHGEREDGVRLTYNHQ